MNRSLTVSIDKLEAAKEAGRLAIVCARFPWELTEAEAKAARLEAEGRRVLLIRWEWEEGEKYAVPRAFLNDTRGYDARAVNPHFSGSGIGKIRAGGVRLLAANLAF